ncbi:dihydrodipicolinate synthase family protein [Pseudorhodoferax sp.]|uniref:dihydrodipicolinate synthase family protein n=1 Tax=Pseudorhodoferax sp. TaxID=1993553 RepID=UPI002DD634D5|nr:dihydrodipicolinate synthase family protein [Pseudorhodoferax sp.]
MSSNRNAEVFAPALTPLHDDLRVNRDAFVRFCRWLVAQGAGLAVFGTNSEASSLSMAEKIDLLQALVEAKIPPGRMMPGVGLCALPETIELTRAALALGCTATLTLPPFYYKPVDDDGLFAYYAEIIQAVGSSALKMYLYHIPQFTGVGISHALIARLIDAYPQTVVGIKDSSGDWANTEGMLRSFPGFRVFPASESLLEKALPLGAAGCISATANVQPGAIAAAIAQWGTDGFAPLQGRIHAVRTLFQKYPMIPALKHAVGRATGEQAWRRVRPPLRALDGGLAQPLEAGLSALGFSMEAL